MGHLSLPPPDACPALTLSNGAINYDTNPNTNGEYRSGTEATLSCSAGYGLSAGVYILTCENSTVSDGVGTWSGAIPTCEGEP